MSSAAAARPPGPRCGGQAGEPVTGLPVLLGVTLIRVAPDRVEATLAVTDAHLAPNGYLHAAAAVALADTACGYGCWAALPNSTGFTTLELTTNYLEPPTPDSNYSVLPPRYTLAAAPKYGTRLSPPVTGASPSRCSDALNSSVLIIQRERNIAEHQHHRANTRHH